MYINLSSSDCVSSSSSILLDSLFLTFLYTHTHIYNMFGSRTTFAAVAALTLGALGVVAQSDAQKQKFLDCTASLGVVGYQPRVNWAYDDPTIFNVTYTYDPTHCDETIPVNYIRLNDFVGSSVTSCSISQFSSAKNSINSVCRYTR